MLFNDEKVLFSLFPNRFWKLKQKFPAAKESKKHHSFQSDRYLFILGKKPFINIYEKTVKQRYCQQCHQYWYPQNKQIIEHTRSWLGTGTQMYGGVKSANEIRNLHINQNGYLIIGLIKQKKLCLFIFSFLLMMLLISVTSGLSRL